MKTLLLFLTILTVVWLGFKENTKEGSKKTNASDLPVMTRDGRNNAFLYPYNFYSDSIDQKKGKKAVVKDQKINMKNIKLVIVASIVLSAFAFTGFKPVYWKVKEGYLVKFEGGTFSKLKATILFDEEHPEGSKITATIDATSVNTGNSEKDFHIKEALDAFKFPVITFVSTAIKKDIVNNGYDATGKLTLKGITKEITFHFNFDSKKDHTEKFPPFFKETFEGKMTIVSKDFNIKIGGEKVTIDLIIPVTQ